jgi:hypothetical protein
VPNGHLLFIFLAPAQLFFALRVVRGDRGRREHDLDRDKQPFQVEPALRGVHVGTQALDRHLAAVLQKEGAIVIQESGVSRADGRRTVQSGRFLPRRRLRQCFELLEQESRHIVVTVAVANRLNEALPRRVASRVATSPFFTSA